jgi:rhomboid protease GluP
MAFEIVACPHCGSQVVPTSDGSCPACRKSTLEPPDTVPVSKAGPSREEAWNQYLESVRSTPASTPVSPGIAALGQVEHDFIDLRVGAIARLRACAGADGVAAERIQQELLPRYAIVLGELHGEGKSGVHADHDTARLVEFANLRRQSWQLLAEALRENDTEKLQQHLQLWGESELLMIDVIVDKPSPAKWTPEERVAQRVAEFHQALAMFTPRPIATPVIVAANVLIFVVMVATGVHFFAPTAQNLADWGGNFGPKTMNGQWWRLVTYMFLHFGILHLAFNMWVLWDLGLLVERLVGNFGFVILYVVSGIAGGIASLAWKPMVVSAGASGAVFGVAGALLGLIAFRHDTIPREVLKHLRGSLGGFLAFNLIFGATAKGIDMAAHVGGVAAGLVCGLILSQPLSAAMMARRPLRNVVVAFVAAIALPLAIRALPNAPPDIGLELHRFTEVEKRVIETANSQLERLRRGVISETEFVETLERDVLPPWIETRHRIEKLLDLSYGNKVFLAKLVAYMRCREESWQLLVEGSREQDLDKIERASQKGAEADTLAGNLGAK